MIGVYLYFNDFLGLSIIIQTSPELSLGLFRTLLQNKYLLN